MLQIPRPLTANERILLALRESGYQGGPQAPPEASQQGLATALRLRLSHTSRALKALLTDGLVVEITGRLPGEVRRRKVYTLTPSGSALAQSLANQVADRVVVAVGPDWSTEMTLLEATRLPGGPYPLARLLSVQRSDGTIHLADLGGGAPRPGPVAFERGRPRSALFVGRTAELAAAAHWSSSGKSVLVLAGAPGVGKTALASEALRALPHPPHTFWHSYREFDARADFLATLGGFLGALGKAELSSRPEITDRELEGLLARDLRDENVLLALDDLHRAPALRTVVAAAVHGATEARSRVIATDREVPDWFEDYRPDEGVLLRLEGLATDDAVRLVRPGITPEEARAIAQVVRGNPRALRLVTAQPDEALEDTDPEERALRRFLRAGAPGAW